MGRTNTNTGIDQAIVDRVIQHLKQKTTDMLDEDMRIPVAHFLSKERADEEIDLLKRLPLIVAQSSEIKRSGDFITRDVLGINLIITRLKNDKVAIYRNMCRHRGGRVETSDHGRKPTFSCKYHGWSYKQDDGSLIHIPQKEVFGDVNVGCHGLERFQALEHNGLIFIVFSSSFQEDIRHYLTPDLDDQIALWKLDQTAVYIDKTFSLDVNWKLVIDGALDSLHPPYLHPQSVAKLVNSKSSVFQDFGRHGRLYQARRKLSDMVSSGEDVSADSKYIASILSVYPNALLMGAPDHVEFWTIWPTLNNPSHCTINIRFLVNPDILTPKMEERIQKSYAILEEAQLTEDWPMEISIQRNMESNPDTTIVYGRGEVSAQHLHRQLKQDLKRNN